MKTIISFTLFGVFIGSLCGLSSSPLALGLMPLVFTFLGGSIFAFYEKLSPGTRTVVFSIIGSISAGGLIGLYSSIIVSSNHLLGPVRIFSDKESGYLRSAEMAKLEPILRLMEQDAIKVEEAAKKIRDMNSK